MRRTLIVAFAVVTSLAAAPSLLATVSGSGLSGGIYVPDPQTLAPERYELAFSSEIFDERNPSTMAKDTTADMSFKVLAGVYDNLEVALERETRLETSYGDGNVTVQAKYRFPIDSFNLSAGLVVPASGPDYQSLFFLAGWKAIHLGFGFNFGGQDLNEIDTTRATSAGTAKFGGYTLRRVVRTGSDTFQGSPDTFYGLFGAQFRMSDAWAALFDWNGDRFTGGFRFFFKDLHVDLAYVGQSEYDSLLDRDSMNYYVGGGVKF